MNGIVLSPDLESLGFRLSLGAAEVDRHLTREEIDLLETIAVRYAGRRTIESILETEEGIES